MLDVHNPKTGLTNSIPFVVVKDQFNYLLRLNTIMKMNLITVNDQSFVANAHADCMPKNDLFECRSILGDLGVAYLRIDRNVPVKVLHCSRVPLALQDRVKAELNDLETREILQRIEEPTDC